MLIWVTASKNKAFYDHLRRRAVTEPREQTPRNVSRGRESDETSLKLTCTPLVTSEGSLLFQKTQNMTLSMAINKVLFAKASCNCSRGSNIVRQRAITQVAINSGWSLERREKQLCYTRALPRHCVFMILMIKTRAPSGGQVNETCPVFIVVIMKICASSLSVVHLLFVSYCITPTLKSKN